MNFQKYSFKFFQEHSTRFQSAHKSFYSDFIVILDFQKYIFVIERSMRLFTRHS